MLEIGAVQAPEDRRAVLLLLGVPEARMSCPDCGEIASHVSAGRLYHGPGFGVILSCQGDGQAWEAALVAVDAAESFKAALREADNAQSH